MSCTQIMFLVLAHPRWPGLRAIQPDFRSFCRYPSNSV